MTERKGPAPTDRPSPDASTPADDTDSSRTRTVYVGVSSSGEPIFTAEAGELLFGIPAAEIRGGLTKGMADGTEPFPVGWLRAGRRRAAEARAATGDTGILAGLAYWAMRDFGATLKIEAAQ